MQRLVDIEKLSYPEELRLNREKLVEMLADPEMLVFVTEQNNNVIGIIILKLKRLSNQIRVLSLAVDPEHRGIGAGKLLFGNAIAMAKYLRLTEISIQIHQEAADFAKVLTENGFKSTKILENYPTEGKKGEEFKLSIT